MAEDGRVFVGDCGTASGTWRLGSGAEPRWAPLRQAFVALGDMLRFGDHECVLSDVLSPVLPGHAASAPATGRDMARPGGRLSRDPWTGEIVRRGR